MLKFLWKQKRHTPLVSSFGESLRCDNFHSGDYVFKEGLREILSNCKFGKNELEIQVPPKFPEKYRPALIRSADQCAVKKYFEHPPEFEITTKQATVQ